MGMTEEALRKSEDQRAIVEGVFWISWPLWLKIAAVALVVVVVAVVILALTKRKKKSK